MFKRVGETLALVHFVVTEMRPVWLLWFIVYNTFRGILRRTAITTAFRQHEVTSCLHEEKLTVRDIEDCAESAYSRYVASGPQIPFDKCGEHCEEALVGIDAPEPRIMYLLMTIWLFGFLLVLLIYFAYRRPNYHTGNYIRFTQTLYGQRAYRIMANCTLVLSILVIVIGIVVLIKNDEDWTQYIVALILVVITSRKLARDKCNGINTNSEKFCQLKISRGNVLMRVLNFLLTTNADLYDRMVVQVIQKGLPRDVRSEPNECVVGWRAIFLWYPLSDENLNEFLTSPNENNAQEQTENV